MSSINNDYSAFFHRDSSPIETPIFNEERFLQKEIGIEKVAPNALESAYPNLTLNKIITFLKQFPAYPMLIPQGAPIACSRGPNIYLPMLDIHYDDETTADDIFIQCISTYKPESPFEPIADRYEVHAYEHAHVIVLTDGCGLSPSSRLAPKAAIAGFFASINTALQNLSQTSNTQTLSHLLLEGLDAAHLNIFWEAYARSKEDLQQYTLYLEKTLAQYETGIIKTEEEIKDIQAHSLYQNHNSVLQQNCLNLTKELKNHQIFIQDLAEELNLLKEARNGHVASKRKLIEQEWEENHQKFYVGTTTFLGATLTQAADPTKYSHYLTCINIGDGKAFRYHNGKIQNIVHDPRPNMNDVRDPGGRIGYCSDTALQADLRNLQLTLAPCNVGDLLFFMTDGVLDNLDPERLGLKAQGRLSSAMVTTRLKECARLSDRQLQNILYSLNASFSAWECLSQKESNYLKQTFSKLLLEAIISNEPSPESANKNIGYFCEHITQKHREYNDWDAQINCQFEDFPGKPDHTTCITILVQ